MILSNIDILKQIKAGNIIIQNLAGDDPAAPPFNTTSVDLRLSSSVSVPSEAQPIIYDLKCPYNAEFIKNNSKTLAISDTQPFTLEPHKLVLAQTLERVHLPIQKDRPSFSARVEGKSSLARLGLVVHLTAPTIHCGFYGPVTLEIINFGHFSIALRPSVYICQVIFEEVSCVPSSAPNQFIGQETPEGTIRPA